MPSHVRDCGVLGLEIPRMNEVRGFMIQKDKRRKFCLSYDDTTLFQVEKTVLYVLVWCLSSKAYVAPCLR